MPLPEGRSSTRRARRREWRRARHEGVCRMLAPSRSPRSRRRPPARNTVKRVRMSPPFKLSLRRAVRPWGVPDLSLVCHAGGRDDLVVESGENTPSCRHQPSTSAMLCVSTGSWRGPGHRARQVPRPVDRHLAGHDGLARLDSSQLPPLSAARSTMTSPGAISPTMSAGNENRRPPTRDVRRS